MSRYEMGPIGESFFKRLEKARKAMEAKRHIPKAEKDVLEFMCTNEAQEPVKEEPAPDDTEPMDEGTEE